MVHEILKWLGETWEPIVVFLGLVFGIGLAGSLGVWLWLRYRDRDQLARLVEKLTGTLDRANATNATLIDSHSKWLAKETELTGAIIQAKNDIDVLKDAARNTEDRYKRQLSELRNEYDQSCKAFADRLTTLGTELKRERETNQELMRQLDALTATNATLMRQVNDLEGRTSLLERDNDNLRIERDALQIEREALRAEVAQLRIEIESIKKHSTGPLDESIASAESRSAAPGEEPHGD